MPEGAQVLTEPARRERLIWGPDRRALGYVFSSAQVSRSGGTVMRPRSLAVVAVPLALCMLAACTKQGTAEKTPANAPSGPQINIAMVTHGQQFDPFWALVQKGAETAASQFNVKLAYQSPGTTNPQEQATMITQAAAAKPAAMVVTIPDPAVLGPPVKQVTAGGMPVVVANVGNGVYQSVGALTFVGQPDYQAGQAAGTAPAPAGGRQARGATLAG